MSGLDRTFWFTVANCIVFSVCVCGRVVDRRKKIVDLQKKEKKAVLGETVQSLSMKPKTGCGQVETGRVEPRFQVAKREGPELLLLSNQEQ